jgi:hypothetical protein
MKTFHVKRFWQQSSGERNTNSFRLGIHGETEQTLWFSYGRIYLLWPDYLPLSRRERIEGEGPCTARDFFRARFKILRLIFFGRPLQSDAIPTKAEQPRIRNSSADESPRPFVGRGRASGAGEGQKIPGCFARLFPRPVRERMKERSEVEGL